MRDMVHKISFGWVENMRESDYGAYWSHGSGKSFGSVHMIPPEHGLDDTHIEAFRASLATQEVILT